MISKKWYIYRNKNGMELRFPKKSRLLWLEGYKLIATVDWFSDEKTVGGK